MLYTLWYLGGFGVVRFSTSKAGSKRGSMRNSVTSPTQQSSSPTRGIPCYHKRDYDD